jgi:arginyl-tRNA--protein-N-Asp/Glu arginylyltransferase
VIKVIFDHVSGFGKITEQDFIYSDPKGIAMSTDFLTYLEEGWIEWQGYWYNLRSTRIKVSEYKPTKTVRRLARKVEVTKVILNKANLELLKPIYDKYVQAKGFIRDIRLEDFEDFEEYSALLYWSQERLIGASIYREYKVRDVIDIVVYQFLWDYENPKLSLGNVAQYYEIEHSKHLANYVYLMGGYEEACIYKSNFKGFEWWTGTEWSSDLDLYTQLCKRDNNVHIRTPQ